MMKLISADASPFARKVRVLLHEADLTDAVETVTITTGPMKSDPTILAANPMGKLPTLIRDSEPAIYDSRVITRFLDTFANAGLYPENHGIVANTMFDPVFNEVFTLSNGVQIIPPRSRQKVMHCQYLFSES